jgi:hypothetical protein
MFAPLAHLLKCNTSDAFFGQFIIKNENIAALLLLVINEREYIDIAEFGNLPASIRVR